VTALVAVDSGEAFVEVAAVEKAIQGFVLDAPVYVPGLAQLVGVLTDATMATLGSVGGSVGGSGLRWGRTTLLRCFYNDLAPKIRVFKP